VRLVDRDGVAGSFSFAALAMTTSSACANGNFCSVEMTIGAVVETARLRQPRRGADAFLEEVDAEDTRADGLRQAEGGAPDPQPTSRRRDPASRSSYSATAQARPR
jgi:hypothetical protein